MNFYTLRRNRTYERVKANLLTKNLKTWKKKPTEIKFKN